MIDVKKLITGFLILATAAVCSGLIFSLTNFTSGTTAMNTAPQVTIAENATGTMGINNANAFIPTQDQVDQVAAELAPELASSTMFVTTTDPSNLTDDLATNFVDGIVAANPDGPSGTDADGNPIFTNPDVNAIAQNVADNNAAKALQIPNWNIEAAAIPVIIVTSSPTALTNYGDALNGILNDHLNEQVQGIASDQTDSASPSDVAYVSSQIKGVLQDAASLKTPAAAETYQKSLLTYLVYQKNMLQLYTLAQTDPVKASILFQQEDEKFSSVQQDLLNQAQTLTSSVLSLEQTPKVHHGNIVLSFVDNTFGIPEAHALWPVFDPATWAMIGSEDMSQIGTQLENILKSTLLQILKNTLVSIIQKKVLVWVQGSGAPRFITNWGTTLINAAQTNAINALNQDINAGCVYSAFAPQISITLKAFYTSSNNACANQFAAALGANSFQSFYNNFSNGGFVTFGASTLPSGNPYGAEFFEAQKTDIAYHNQQAASALQTQTSQGFTGDQICDDGSKPSGNSTVCEDSSGAFEAPSTGGSCPTGDKPVTVPNNGLCTDGTHPIVQTPSAVTAFTLQNTTGATTQQITAANDIAGLLNSVLSSLVLGLASAAVNAAGQLVNQTLTSVDPSTITAGATTTPPAQIPLSCNPSSQTIPSSLASGGPVATSTPTPTSTAPASLSAIGGTLDVNDNPPVYYWSDTNGASSTGPLFSDTFFSPGTYTITLTDSTGDAPTTCTVIQQ